MTTLATLGAIAVLAACLCVVVVVFLPDLRTRWHSRREGVSTSSSVGARHSRRKVRSRETSPIGGNRRTTGADSRAGCRSLLTWWYF